MACAHLDHRMQPGFVFEVDAPTAVPRGIEVAGFVVGQGSGLEVAVRVIHRRGSDLRACGVGGRHSVSGQVRVLPRPVQHPDPGIETVARAARQANGRSDRRVRRVQHRRRRTTRGRRVAASDRPVQGPLHESVGSVAQVGHGGGTRPVDLHDRPVRRTGDRPQLDSDIRARGEREPGAVTTGRRETLAVPLRLDAPTTGAFGELPTLIRSTITGVLGHGATAASLKATDRRTRPGGHVRPQIRRPVIARQPQTNISLYRHTSHRRRHQTDRAKRGLAPIPRSSPELALRGRRSS